MLRVLACVQNEHDPLLVVLAVCVCAITAAAAFYIHGIASQADGFRRACWIVLTGVASGAGIWATHFIAMLAFNAGPYPVVYDPALTFASLLIAILFTATGFAIAISEAPWWRSCAGGVVIGAGIFSMHYTGMAAMKFPGTIAWDPDLVAASLILGVLFAAAATTLFHHAHPRVLRWLAPVFLTIAICSLHFTAMGAAVLNPDPTILIQGPQLDTGLMAMAVAGITLVVILMGLVAALIDHAGGRESTVRQSELANAAGEGIVVAKSGWVISVNRRMSELCGWAPDELVSKAVFGDILSSHKHPDSMAVETWLRTSTNGPIPVEVSRHPYGCRTGANEVYIVRDLRERREAERLRYMAHHDPLTGLPNRAAFAERLKAGIARAREAEKGFAILFIDLDGFKQINDTHGHLAGDRVLCEVARRLSGAIGPTEFLCRTGGDEFVILQSSGAQPGAATRLGKRLLGSFKRPCELENGRRATLGLSIGVAVYPSDGETQELLLRNADTSLYWAKNNGGGLTCFAGTGREAA